MTTATIEQIAGTGSVYAINDANDIVFVAATQQSSQISLVVGGKTTNFTVAGYAYGVHMNSSGELEFQAEVQTGTTSGGGTAVTVATYAVENGTLTALPNFATLSPLGEGIDDAGQVVGSLQTNASTVFNQSNAGLNSFIWQNGTVSAVTDATQGTSISVNIQVGGCNGNGDLIGGAVITTGFTAPEHGWLWKNGTATDLGMTGNQFAAVSAVAINNNDVIAGEERDTYGISPTTPFLWQNGKMSVLPTLAATDQYTYIGAINSKGIVVGDTGTSTASTPVAWENGAVIDLNSLLPANSGWVLTSVSGINDSNEVVGNGTLNGTAAMYELALPDLTALAATAVAHYQAGLVTYAQAVTDSAANVSASLDSLETMAKAGLLGAVTFTDSGTPTVTLTIAQMSADAGVLAKVSGSYAIGISDSAADVTSALDSLATLANAGKVASITLTDGGIPTLTVTAAQVTADAAALKAISGYFSLIETAPASSATLAGSAAALGNTLEFSGTASQYTITPNAANTGFTIAGNGVTDTVSDIQAVKFSDATLIIAQAPGSSSAPTSGNITELYAAVFGRLPDVPGLAYYQNQLAANPATPLTAFAQQFLASPEYQNNSAHNYAQTTAGDTQFITDLYSNLLHRAPGAADAGWYETNVIAPIVSNATPGTAAYTTALAAAHAAVVTDFSQSAEFLGDVQVTATTPASSQHWLVLV